MTDVSGKWLTGQRW